MNQLFIKTEVSLLKKKIYFLFSKFLLSKMKNITKEMNIKINRKLRIYIPLDGSFAKVWTELRIPDLTRNVPVTLNIKVTILNIIDQFFKRSLFSKVEIQCNRAVKLSHGIKEIFSTGSQNQKPPHPNS